MADYLFPSDTNTVHDITYDDIHKLLVDNYHEGIECRTITQSTYNGESYLDETPFSRQYIYKENLYRVSKTSGTLVHWPHGIIINQAQRRNYYRGERQVFGNAVPSLLRKLVQYNNEKDKELYRLVADMRIAEFISFLNTFQHTQQWKYCDVLYDMIAQHYGIDTGWLDITTNFNVALFFATCYFNNKLKRWMPLTKEETELSEKTKYGMIFHMPSKQMYMRLLLDGSKFTFTNEQFSRDDFVSNSKQIFSNVLMNQFHISNLVFPIGFQPFMRCHMQEGYGIYMREPNSLELDTGFEKLRFRHNEKLSSRVYEMMDGGRKVMPHEGLINANFIIEEISNLTTFSKAAFEYALHRSHYYRLIDVEECLNDLSTFCIDGKAIQILDSRSWKMSRNRRRLIDRIYSNFDIQNEYQIKVLKRQVLGSSLFMVEPWMLPDKECQRGIVDFEPRKVEQCDSFEGLQRELILYMVEHAGLPDF